MNSLDGGLDPWLVQLFEKLMKMCPLPPGKEILPERTLYVMKLSRLVVFLC